MPRRAKGPRLYLRKRKGRDDVWVIRDRSREFSTGCLANETRQAEKSLASYIENKWEADTRQRSTAKIPIVEVLAHYAETRAKENKHRWLAAIHIENLLGFWDDKSLAQINRRTCMEYVDWRCSQTHNKRNISTSTARRELAVLQSAINNWHQDSPLPSVPVVTKPKQAPPRDRVLTRKEAAALLWAARELKLPHVARFVLIGLYTGTRHGAIASMLWRRSPSAGWFDLENGLMYRRGYRDTETSKRRPPTRIPRRLLAKLIRWEKADRENGTIAVINWKGGPVARIHKAWRRAADRAGLGKEVTPHILRHSCATWALREGQTIWDVAGLLGASVDTIDKTYGHHSIEAQDAITGAFSGAKSKA